jgi:hypothetical protein
MSLSCMSESYKGVLVEEIMCFMEKPYLGSGFSGSQKTPIIDCHLLKLHRKVL